MNFGKIVLEVNRQR